MTRISLIIFFLVMPVVVWAQPLAVPASAQHDFGQVNEGVLLQHSFQVKNTGTAPLALLKLTSS
ncbi:MAG TPA: hypothetical protein VK445_12190 [Dissulfurispiraceae bacterium]|nr:hypothetical protein [Dissulfurispiraceae bacterium]